MISTQFSYWIWFVFLLCVHQFMIGFWLPFICLTKILCNLAIFLTCSFDLDSCSTYLSVIPCFYPVLFVRKLYGKERWNRSINRSWGRPIIRSISILRVYRFGRRYSIPVDHWPCSKWSPFSGLLPTLPFFPRKYNFVLKKIEYLIISKKGSLRNGSPRNESTLYTMNRMSFKGFHCLENILWSKN